MYQQKVKEKEQKIADLTRELQAQESRINLALGTSRIPTDSFTGRSSDGGSAI